MRRSPSCCPTPSPRCHLSSPDEHEIPRVFLGVPHYGPVSMGLLQSITLCVRDRNLIQLAAHAQSSSSVLPHCFNSLWCHALEARDKGQVTHFAMCHSDIIAEPGWLDRLYSAMWAEELDLVSAVVPIKGPTGRTSTAVGVETDPWSVPRCIYLHDRKTLPETFTTHHVRRNPGDVLLVNTGLMLLDLRRPYWDDFAFQFHTRIRKTVLPDGSVEYASDQRSEDWEMSHHLHRHGARYGATWAVRLRHEGGAMYPNYDEPRVYPAAPDRPKWLDIDGWLTLEEGRTLQQLAAGGHVLELGSYKGRSTVCMAETAAQVYSVDWHKGDAKAGDQDTWDEFHANVDSLALCKVSTLRNRFEDVLPSMPAAMFDMVFVDDDHGPSTEFATREALRLVKPGGVIAWHDWPDPAVVAAARSCGLEPQAIVGSLAWTTIPEA